MMIRVAKPKDKKAVLDFCKTTFSWGDYISDVWDRWITEGQLFVIEKDVPIGICHASFFPNKNQMWIEGIRIHPRHRRKGYAQMLVSNAESFAIKNKFQKSRMLIEVNNVKSIQLAKKLEYKIESKWNLYSLTPKKRVQTASVRFATYTDHLLELIPHTFYVKSWQWIPFDRTELKGLIRKKEILLIEHNGEIDCFGILIRSKQFPKIIQFTLVYETHKRINDILRFIQNFAYEMKYEKIQILAMQNYILNFRGLQERYSFYLMEKNL